MTSSGGRESPTISSDACCMAFTPQSCPTKGGEVVFVSYSEDFPLPEGGDFFLVFAGSKQRHVTTAQQINCYTLRAIIPGHDVAERVSLTVYCLKNDTIGVLSAHKFLYVLETEQILAELLAERSSDSAFLEALVPLCSASNNVPCDLRNTLDYRLTSAFEFLDLSPTWTLVGENGKHVKTSKGQETLLHLSARLGFTQFAEYLVDLPGASQALGMCDTNGKSPMDVAKEKGLRSLADVFLRGPGSQQAKSQRDNSKPHVKKSEIGTTTISSHNGDAQNTLERDIDMLQDINNLVRDEMKQRISNFRHAWPVRKKQNHTLAKESSSDEEERPPNDLRTPKNIGINNLTSPKPPGSNRQLLEQNLKRLRDINEEIQRLRLVNQNKGTRELGRGRPTRRLSCPSFRGQDILQAHLLMNKAAGKDENISINGTSQARADSQPANSIRPSRQKDHPLSRNKEGDTNLQVDDKSDILRRRSWGDHDSEEQKPDFRRRVSSSLDDLSGEGTKKKKDPSRSRTQVVDLPAHLTKQEESNKLADILDSIKKASDERQGEKDAAVTRGEGLGNRVSMQGKSYSLACLADLRDEGEDGSDLQNSGEMSSEVTEDGHRSPTLPERKISKGETKMSLLDFLNDDEKKKILQSSPKKPRKWPSTTNLGAMRDSLDKASHRISLEEFLLHQHQPEVDADDSDGVIDKIKSGEADKKGIRRLSMLFGNKSSRTSKRDVPKLAHSKSNVRSSMRKEKAQSTINLSTKEDFKDKLEPKDLKDTGNKTALGRRASGLSSRNRPGEGGPTLPNPGMLAKPQGGRLPVRSHSGRSTSPLPFRKSLGINHDEGDNKSVSSATMSVDDGSPDEDEDDEPVFNMEGLNDSDLEFKEEPEAWSVTVDKKTLKKMTAKDIKRQDVIHELIQTEVHYVRTLKIMHKIFYNGMVTLLNLSRETVDQLFPQLEELLDLNGTFLTRLKHRQDEDIIVDKIGDILEIQFSGITGERMKAAYGDFCSHHIEAVELYKKLLRTDKRFADFVKKCGLNKFCRRLSVPECITLVTQRLTKYPLLIEAIIKTTKESKPDYSGLKKSHGLVKDILTSVDDTIKEYEKQKKLQDIKMKMDLKVTITYKGNKKVKNIDFASNTSKLIYDGLLSWKTARGKLTETVAVVLEDMMVFLQEKDQKYTMLSLDQKAPVIRLRNLMVREVATDMKAIFLVSTSKEGPEMYEMVCNTISEKKMWMKTLRDAIRDAPKDDGHGEIITTGADEKRKVLLRRSSVLIEHVQNGKDSDTLRKYLAEMQELISQLEAEEVKVDGDKKEQLLMAREELMQAMLQVQQSLPSGEEDDKVPEGNLGERLSSLSEELGPKRADTFSGFDNKLKPNSVDQAVIRASSMKTERLGKTYSRPVTDNHTPTTGSPLTKHKRRGSGGGSGGSTWFANKGKNDSGSDLASMSASSSPGTQSPSAGQEESMENDRNDSAKTGKGDDVIYF
ncbi:A-kinase anchor protein 13 isoform X3 [Nematostella vectensis]|uniref:A-kinase anchor protein 13 isoform X3 n=1 Tax=Nematostella vectensis TaxID=45351 RepID=UPI002076E643|nr:A-kinase anchor protein 13 isoform X3 [Nematostella vectensis]